MILNFRTSSGIKTQIVIDDSDLDSTTVSALKDLLAPKINFPASEIRLIAGGRAMSDDNSTLSTYNLTSETTISVVRSAANSTTPTSSTSRNSTLPTSPSARTSPANPLGLPPEMLRSAINAMTANPEFMQSMLQADPRMQRLMETHPEVRHLLSDPQFMRQRMEEMMNPNMMNEAMRNQDRALSNIEAMPGGMNYLQQMYRSMHEPFAESSDPDPSSDELNRRFAQQLGLNLDTTRPSDSPNSEALPNPWARPNTTTSRSPLSPLQSGTQQPTVNPFMNMFGQQQQTSPLQGNPSHLQMLHQLQQLDSFLRHSNPSTTTSTLNPYPFSQTNFPLPQPSSLSNQQPTITTTSASTTASSEVPPEEKYAAQLQQLADMGFNDKKKCIRALLASGGNADAAVAYLLD